MRKYRWLIIMVAVLVGLLALGITIGTVWLNTFIHSKAFRQEVELRASQTLGGPVTIQSLDFNFFTGIELRGVETQVDSTHVNGQGALVASVESVRCTYSIADLFHRRLRLTGVTLEKPAIVLTRQPVATITPPHSDADSIGGEDGATVPAKAFQFVLDSARINHGSLSIRDAVRRALSDLTGIEIRADTAAYYEGKPVTGKLRIADVAFSPNLHITGLSTPWTFDPHGNYITATPYEAAAFGGRLAGAYQLGAEGPSILDLNVRGLDVVQIGRTAQPSSPVRLSGSLDGQSKWRGVETGQLTGEGDLQLSKGKLEGVRTLQELAGVFRVRELAAPDLRSVHTHFLVAHGVTRFTGLQIDAGVFQMTGDGTIGAGGVLDADMVLILSADAMTRLPREAAAFLVQKPDGSASIAYHLGGTIDNPRNDLGTRILMQGAAVKNVISNALNRFFHRHSKAPQEQAPSPASPAPETDQTAPPSGP